MRSQQVCCCSMFAFQRSQLTPSSQSLLYRAGLFPTLTLLVCPSASRRSLCTSCLSCHWKRACHKYVMMYRVLFVAECIDGVIKLSLYYEYLYVDPCFRSPAAGKTVTVLVSVKSDVGGKIMSHRLYCLVTRIIKNGAEIVVHAII